MHNDVRGQAITTCALYGCACQIIGQANERLFALIDKRLLLRHRSRGGLRSQSGTEGDSTGANNGVVKRWPEWDREGRAERKKAAKPSEKPDENSSRAGTQRKGRLEGAVECGIRTRGERRDGLSGGSGDPFCENIRGADGQRDGGGGSASPLLPSIHPAHVVAPTESAPSSPLLLSSIWGTKSGGGESEKGRRQRLQPPPPPLRSALLLVPSFLPLSSNLHQCRCQWKKTEVELRPTPLLLSFSR